MFCFYFLHSLLANVVLYHTLSALYKNLAIPSPGMDTINVFSAQNS